MESQIIEMLLNNGMAGIVMAYFIYDKITFQRDVKHLIENNTKALARFYEHMRKVER